MELNLIKLYENKIIKYFKTGCNCSLEYDEQKKELNFVLQESNEKKCITKTFDEISEIIVYELLSKKEIQKVGNIISRELSGSYLYFENNEFVLSIKQRKHKVYKNNFEILNILEEYKNVNILPKLTIKKSYKNKEFYTLGGTLEKRKNQYKLKDYVETNCLFEVPTIFYAEGLKKWIECISYFEKEEYKLILSKLK